MAFYPKKPSIGVLALFNHPIKPLSVRTPIDSLPQSKVLDYLSQHLMIDAVLKEGTVTLPLLKEALIYAIQQTTATILGVDASINQETGDMMVMAMISESHFCVHHIKSGKASQLIFDGHTCGTRIQPKKAYHAFCDFLKNAADIQFEMQSIHHYLRDIMTHADQSDSLSNETGEHFCQGMALMAEENEDISFQDQKAIPNQNKVIHVHQCIGSFYQCQPLLLNDASQIMSILFEAMSPLTKDRVIDMRQHTFDPPGVSAVLSHPHVHATFHTWPGHGSIACDVMLIDTNNDTVSDLPSVVIKKIMQNMAQALGCLHTHLIYHPRGMVA